MGGMNPTELRDWIATSFLAGCIALCGLEAWAQQPTKLEGVSTKWEIRWSASDEFNADSVDWKKWIREGGLPMVSSWRWNNAENVTANQGVAQLTFRHEPGKDRAGKTETHFTSGILKSYRTFTYGFFEARIKGVPFPGTGVCPSFWLFSDFDDGVEEGGTVYCEVDVVEMQQFDWLDGHQDDVKDIDFNLHCVVKENGKRSWRRPKAFPDAQLSKWRAPWDPREDFHIYGCEIGKEEIVWYVDGKEVARKPNTHWHRPMHVALSLGARKPFVRFEGNRHVVVDPVADAEAVKQLDHLPTSMSVDYVRVWEERREE